MRNLGSLDNPQQAESFLAYLLVQGIEGHFDAQSNPPEIWVKDEDRLAEAVDELAAFRQNPTAPKYAAALSQAKAIKKQQAQKTKAMQKNIVHVAHGGLNKKPHLTMLLIGLCGIVGLLTNFGIMADVNQNGVLDTEDQAIHLTQPVYRWLQFTCIGPPESQELNQTYPEGERDALALRTVSLQRGEVWRLFTPIFIHHGVMHIVFNLYMLFSFGSLIERRYNWKRLLMLTLLASSIPNFVQCTVPEYFQGIAPIYEGGYMVTGLGGMSGVVYGLFGFVWVKSSFDPKFGFRIPQSSIIIMMVWLFGCMFADQLKIGIFPTNIANWAHGVGLLVGMTVAYLQSPESK